MPWCLSCLHCPLRFSNLLSPMSPSPSLLSDSSALNFYCSLVFSFNVCVQLTSSLCNDRQSFVFTKGCGSFISVSENLKFFCFILIHCVSSSIITPENNHWGVIESPITPITHMTIDIHEIVLTTKRQVIQSIKTKTWERHKNDIRNSEYSSQRQEKQLSF